MGNKFCIPIIIVLSLVSCQDFSQDKKIEYYYGNRIKVIKHYKNDLMDGQAQWFYLDGTLEQSIMFKNGKENGNAYYFYPSGALKYFRNWKDGKMIGYGNDFFDSSVWVMKSVLYYNENGDLVYKKNYTSTGKAINEERNQSSN